MGSLKRVVVLRSEDSYDGHVDTIFGREKKKRRKKRKKQSKFLSPLEKIVRRAAKNQVKASDSYLERHEKSNRKKRNGWIRDYNKNASKALSKLGGIYKVYGDISPF
ncbi:MAG: hypothetical protein ACKO3I_07365 [Synechococcales cyanobacterium]